MSSLGAALLGGAIGGVEALNERINKDYENKQSMSLEEFRAEKQLQLQKMRDEQAMLRVQVQQGYAASNFHSAANIDIAKQEAIQKFKLSSTREARKEELAEAIARFEAMDLPSDEMKRIKKWLTAQSHGLDLAGTEASFERTKAYGVGGGGTATAGALEGAFADSAPLLDSVATQQILQVMEESGLGSRVEDLRGEEFKDVYNGVSRVVSTIQDKEEKYKVEAKIRDIQAKAAQGKNYLKGLEARAGAGEEIAPEDRELFTAEGIRKRFFFLRDVDSPTEEFTSDSTNPQNVGINPGQVGPLAQAMIQNALLKREAGVDPQEILEQAQQALSKKVGTGPGQMSKEEAAHLLNLLYTQLSE